VSKKVLLKLPIVSKIVETIKKAALVLFTVLFALAILTISVISSSRPLAFSASPKPSPSAAEVEARLGYTFVYPGRILPDSPLWYFKAFRDRVWLIVTTNSMKKAELSLLFADKRLIAAEKLFKDNKPQLALSTLTKAEKYLENASSLEAKERKGGADTKSFLATLAKASLAHIAKIKQVIAIAPDDIRPGIIKVEDYPISIYKECQSALQALGSVAPKNPFEGN
jgi:hypothetical protein